MLPDSYFAGIIDGEGTIRVQNANRGTSQYYPMVRVTSVNSELVEVIKSRFGGWIRRYQPKSSKGYDNCREAYEWTIQGREGVLAVVTVIQPYCIIRRDHVKLMVEFITQGEVSHPPAPVSQVEIARRHKIFEQFGVLNKRGIA